MTHGETLQQGKGYHGFLINMSSSEREDTSVQRQTGAVGATGFVGSAVIRALRASGDDPISLVPRVPAQDRASNSLAKSRSVMTRLIRFFADLIFSQF